MMTVYNKYYNCYHTFVAQRRRTTQKKNSRGAQAVVIFWLIFVIVIITVFMANYDTIKRNFALLKTRLTSASLPEEELLNDDLPDEPVIPEFRPSNVTTNEQTIVTVEPSGQIDKTNPQTTDDKPITQQTTQQTATQQTTSQQTTQQTTGQQTQTQTTQSAQTRERAIYFTQIDKDGQILQSKVTRRIPVSESPMQDALNIMLAGPSADEINRGILNIIPKNTRILSSAVRGNTAYISFSEDFMFNTFGVEGFVAQLRQVVWTVTEFSNVNDVQILIEGRRLDYLGEGIWIGSPISRKDF
jgi:spore germination protein GerM